MRNFAENRRNFVISAKFWRNVANFCNTSRNYYDFVRIFAVKIFCNHPSMASCPAAMPVGVDPGDYCSSRTLLWPPIHLSWQINIDTVKQGEGGIQRLNFSMIVQMAWAVDSYKKPASIPLAPCTLSWQYQVGRRRLFQGNFVIKPLITCNVF
jgi:hypothetical protein